MKRINNLNAHDSNRGSGDSYSPVATIISVSMLILSLFSLIKARELVKVELSDELVIEEIALDVFLVTHSFPWPGNSLGIRLDDHNLLWIDTPYTPDATAQVLDWFLGRFGNQMKVTEINTGFHIDNLGGNRELKRRKFPIYGSNLTCELLRTKSKATMAKLDVWLNDPNYARLRDVYRDFIFTEPTNVFDIKEKQVITVGTENVEIYFPGPTHTYDNVVVYLPGRKILFGGCMVLSAEANKLGFIDDGNVAEWAKSIGKVKTRYRDITIVVPGHGKAGGKSLLDHTMAVIDEFQSIR